MTALRYMLVRVGWSTVAVLGMAGSGCAPGPAPAPTPSAPVVVEKRTPPVATAPSTVAPVPRPGRKIYRSPPVEQETPVTAPSYATSPEKLKKGILERPDAARMVVSLIKESVDYGPTLIVWVVDRSASARELVADMGRLVGAQLSEVGLGAGASEPSRDAKLLMAVVSFGGDVKFEVDPPSSDPQAAAAAISRLEQDTSGKEVTFAAIQAALEKYLPFRTQQRKEVVFIVISDEAGDDGAQVDQLLDAPQKAGIPFYVVGVPAPFGKDAAVAPSVEMGLDYKPGGTWLAIRQGPESRRPEVIRMGFWGGGAVELSLIDSGFGPFALERLCRATGGRYLALRPDTSQFAFVSAVNSQWPSPGAITFDLDTLRRYTPDYVSEQEYQTLLTNKARRAVVDAAQLGELEMLEFPQTAFHKADEAAMARVLSQAQQVAAKLSPVVDRVYAAVESGEADRPKVTEPRWQAGYDLAMGRAAAAKARVDGYNHMLAALKRGKPFTKPDSTGWILEPADSIEGASALQKLVDKSQVYLLRVVTDHAGTPWARLAAKELESPCGWKWTER